MRGLIHYLRPVVLRFLFSLFMKITGSVADLMLPWLLAHMIDEVFPQKDIYLTGLWGGMMLVCSAAAAVTNIVSNRMASGVAGDMTREIRHDLFRRIAYLSCRQADEFSTPSMISRLTSDTYNVHSMISMMQRLGVRAPFLLLGGISITLTMDTALALVLVAVLPLVAVLVYFISKNGIVLYDKLQKSVDDMVRILRENITGMRIIRSLSKSGFEKERFARVNRAVTSNEQKANRNMAFTTPTMNFLLNIGLVLVIAVGAFRVDLGLTQPGKVIAILTYFIIILNAMLSVTRVFVLISKGSASFGRIEEIIHAPEDLLLQECTVSDTEYHVSFDHVSFRYPGGQNGLSDVSFSLKKGETLGVIGATGSGKSTILKLLMRFYDADEGSIRIDGRDVRSIPGDELHTKFGIVFQNDVLFADTIAANIDFGRRLTAEQIANSSEFAQAEEFISSFSDGSDHKVTIRGANLSGGQRQRILISRALAANPEILILDDSSSALDYRTDARLRSALGKNFQETTTIIVSQRISSILHADQILVLEGGRCLGLGTHEELLESCESYRRINGLQIRRVSR